MQKDYQFLLTFILTGCKLLSPEVKAVEHHGSVNTPYAESGFICHSGAGNVKQHLRSQTRKDSRAKAGQNIWPKLIVFNLAYHNAIRLAFTTDRKTLNKIKMLVTSTH